MEALVSVIVVTYNSAKTVVDTLDSIASQRYADIELIVADDCSKDDTVSVAERWIAANGKRFGRTEVVRSLVNSGVTVNAQRGVVASKGEWIKIIAGDDMLRPNAVERFLEEACRTERNFFFARMELFYDDPAIAVSEERKAFYEEAYGIFRRGFNAAEQNEIIRYSNNFCPAPAAFFSRDAFDGVGGFDLSIVMAEDMPLWLRATEKGFRLMFIDEPLVRYRVGEGSVQKKGCFSVTKRLLKYKYLLRTRDYGMYEKIKQLYGYNSLSNRCYFMVLKLLSLRNIYAFRQKAEEVSAKYGVTPRKITIS